ncbi:hypothetical protein NQ314_017628 [Rhamnusium bicolor]|uniref:DUF5641 domain-containing protein n=1 Tax=Rhamnusium bicolor TaxID=1586634 RepID=A0AAV8WS92_9CUCU|nr:hypothetical protein NQ314_017628 [Rhamnusium bicolor]
MWELEDFTPPVPTSEDSICENYFVENVSRNSFGRYEVALPFKADPTHLGDSFVLSQTRLPDIKNAVTIHTQLVKLFENGGFQMVKWMSNSNELLSQIPDFLQLNTPIAFDKESLKVLGLEWNPSSDNFSFKISVSVSPCTKRNMLSLVARIFDPLGFLAPISLFIKLLIKKLWKLKFDWDQEAPKEMFHLWMKFQEELTLLNSLRIPRHLLIFENSTVDIVGFADATEDLLTESPNRLNRYKLLDSVVQHYWKRWHIEYLSTLQARQKWNTPTNPAQIGMIVVIIQNNIPPLQWPLAIIEKLYPGKDGISRVALVRTKNSSYTRPVAKLCPLPNQS